MAEDLVVRTNPGGGPGVVLQVARSALPTFAEVTEVSEWCFELRSGTRLLAHLYFQFTDQEGNDIAEADQQTCNSILFSYEGTPAEHLSYLLTVQKVTENLGWVVEDRADGEIYEADDLEAEISMMQQPKSLSVKPIEDFEPYSPLRKRPIGSHGGSFGERGALGAAGLTRETDVF